MNIATIPMLIVNLYNCFFETFLENYFIYSCHFNIFSLGSGACSFSVYKFCNCNNFIDILITNIIFIFLYYFYLFISILIFYNFWKLQLQDYILLYLILIIYKIMLKIYFRIFFNNVPNCNYFTITYVNL